MQEKERTLSTSIFFHAFPRLCAGLSDARLRSPNSTERFLVLSGSSPRPQL